MTFCGCGQTVNSQQQQNKQAEIKFLGIKIGTSPTTRPTWLLKILMEVKPLLFPIIYRRRYSKTHGFDFMILPSSAKVGHHLR